MSAQLIKYEAACRALAECKAVDEVKAWADKAAAMQAYGKMAKDKSLEIDASEIRIRAERRLGEMLAAQKADGGLNKGVRLAGNEAGRGQGSPAVVADDHRPKLADAGISKDLSSRAQKLAAVPEDEFEAALVEKREVQQREGERVTARLLKRGERAIREQEEAPSDADSGQTLDEIIAEIQRENEQLHAQLKAMEADDTKAELRKALLQRDHAVRQQSEAMDKAAASQKREKRSKHLLMRCGRAVGEEDPEKIPATVEAMARQFKKAA